MVSSYRNNGTISQELRYPFTGTVVQFWQESSLEMAEQVASGKMNCAEAPRAYGSHEVSVRYWTALYKEHGPASYQGARHISGNSPFALT